MAGAVSHPSSTGDHSRITALPSSEALSLSGSNSLREALAAIPEIRPEVVEEGRRLAVDPNYPPLQIIEGLAEMLLQSADPSEQV
jgi:hypothetical protein